MKNKIIFFIAGSVVPAILFFTEIEKFYYTPMGDQGNRLKYLLIAIFWVTCIFLLAAIQFGLIKNKKKKSNSFDDSNKAS